MNIIQSIGNTPMVEINSLLPKDSRVRIFVKMEGLNPGGSIKDRSAYYMMREAESAGKLKPGVTILEATSGNTGIALAMIGAARGYRVKLVMSGGVTPERQQILQALGAEVELTPADQGTDGAIIRVEELLHFHPDKYFNPNQYKNRANLLAHYETTGPEIWRQTGGKIDYFVAGMGTTGTLMGVGRFLSEKKPTARVVGVEPEMGHSIQGLKNMEEAKRPPLYQPQQLHKKIVVTDQEAFSATRHLAHREGIFVGLSSGAALQGALKLAQELEHGIIVTILADRGDRYLSTNVFKKGLKSCI
jgi:cysteine synthase B